MTELALPADWSSKRLKYLATYNDEVLTENTNEDREIDYVEISGVSLSRGIEEVEHLTFGQAPSRARRKVKNGDILISTVRTYLRAIATVDEASPKLIASTGFCVIRPNDDVDSGFIGWVAKSEPFVSVVVARSVGVSYPAINASELVTIDIPLPPLNKQRRIARFLDEKTACIDGLIEKKQLLLDRLAEKRQTLITCAVTKGLNPNAPMKPTGIDWLGDIPAHWDCCGLGQKIKLQRGVDITKAERVDGPFPVVSSGGIDYFHETALCRGPGVLVGRKGSAGKLHYVEADYWPHDTTLYIREFRGNVPKYVWYMLHTLDLTSFDTGSSNPTVNRNRVHPMQTAWPNPSEQAGIVSQLDVEFGKIGKLDAVIVKSIQQLEEYRAVLITAAVTGKMTGLQ